MLTLCDFVVPLHRYVSINGLLKRLCTALNDIFSKTNTKSQVVPSCNLESVTHLQCCVQPSFSSQCPLQNVAYPSHVAVSLSRIPHRVVQSRACANPSCKLSVIQTYRLPGVTLTTVFFDTQLWKTRHPWKRFKISVSLAFYRQIGSKSTNHNKVYNCRNHNEMDL